MLTTEGFVKDQFPLKYWPIIPTVLKTAYAAVDDNIKNTPFLNVESAKTNKGRLIAYAVDYGLERAIQNGSLNCDYRWKSFAKPTGHFLELRFSHSTASVSQVAEAAKPPRSVVFRENARLRNQGVFDFPEFQDELELAGVPHLLLVYGHQQLNFSHICVPSPLSKTDYVWRSRNLMDMVHEEIKPEGPEPENTDIDLDELGLLKEDIDRWRRDHDEE